MLSAKCKYSIRAVLYISVNSSKDHRIGIKSIAENLKIPMPYAGKILNELVRKEIVSSKKGPTGGFFQTEKGLNLPIINIIDAIDGLSFFNKCALGLDECSDDRPCPIHYDFKKSKDHLKKILESKTIAQLAVKIKRNELFLVK